MIIYDLKCSKNHEFEGWFKDRAAFELQKEQSLILCPECNDTGVEIVPSLPMIRGREKKKNEDKYATLSRQQVMKQLDEFIEKNFDDVGAEFSEVAIRIHEGSEDPRNIRGTTTQQDEEVLREKGVPFVKIPIIKLDS